MVLVGPISGHGIGGFGLTDSFKERSSCKVGGGSSRFTDVISIVQKGEHAVSKTQIKYFGFTNLRFSSSSVQYGTTYQIHSEGIQGFHSVNLNLRNF